MVRTAATLAAIIFSMTAAHSDPVETPTQAPDPFVSTQTLPGPDSVLLDPAVLAIAFVGALVFSAAEGTD